MDDLEVLLSSAGAPWHDVVLEWHRLQPNEISKLFPKQHTIVICLNLTPARTWRLSHGQLRHVDSVAGDICVGPAGSMTGLRWRDPLDLLVLSLSQTVIADNAIEWHDPARIELIRHDRVRDPLIEQIGLALRAELLEGCPLGGLYGDALANAFAVHLLRRYSAHALNQREYKGGLGGRRLRLTLDYMEANLAGNVRLGELARNAGLSSTYFITAFERSTGVTPHQWVLRRRIDRATRMLAEGRMSIIEIAAALGFADQSHFCRAFRRFIGDTPASFARKMP